jgi:hypothetical protein
MRVHDACQLDSIRGLVVATAFPDLKDGRSTPFVALGWRWIGRRNCPRPTPTHAGRADDAHAESDAARSVANTAAKPDAHPATGGSGLGPGVAAAAAVERPG